MKSIFVSSTFKDMQTERDLLQEKVLPRLNMVAADYQEEISLCDLRWGIDTGNLDSEEGAAKILAVCLDEIDRCEPYMIVILGYRYGWIPDSQLIENVAVKKHGLELEDLEKSVTALEIEYGALRNKKLWDHTLFYFREIKSNVSDIYSPESEAHQQKLNELKARIKKIAGDRVHNYTLTKKLFRNELNGYDSFTEMVYRDILAMMEPEFKNNRNEHPFDKDHRKQKAYAKQLTKPFCTSMQYINKAAEDIMQKQNLFILQGSSGTGKSTFISMLADSLKKQGAFVWQIFGGYTDLSADINDIYRQAIFGLCKALNKPIPDYSYLLHADENSLMEMQNTLTAEFESHGNGKFVFIADAIDQFIPSQSLNNLSFLPDSMNHKVAFVLSCTDDFSLPHIEGIFNMPSYTDQDKELILNSILSESGRELEPVVKQAIIDKTAANKPLYIKFAIQRLLLMNKNDFLEIKKLGDNMQAITRHQLDIISSLPEQLEDLSNVLLKCAWERVGKKMAQLAVEYMAVTLHGICEREIRKLASSQKIPFNSLDLVTFFHFLPDLFILREDGRYDFMHKSMRRGIRNMLGETITDYHSSYMNVLMKRGMKDPICLEELAYHAIKGQQSSTYVSLIEMSKNKTDIEKMLISNTKLCCLEDGGEWITELINSQHNNKQVMYFINFRLTRSFDSSRQEKEIARRIQLAGVEYNSSDNRSSLKNSVEQYRSLETAARQYTADIKNWDKGFSLAQQTYKLADEMLQKHKSKVNKIYFASASTLLASFYQQYLSENEYRLKARELQESAITIIEDAIKKRLQEKHLISGVNLESMLADYLVAQAINYRADTDHTTRLKSWDYCKKAITYANIAYNKQPNENTYTVLGRTYACAIDQCIFLETGEPPAEAEEWIEKCIEIHKKLIKTDKRIKIQNLYARALFGATKIMLKYDDKPHAEKGLIYCEDAKKLALTVAAESDTYESKRFYMTLLADSAICNCILNRFEEASGIENELRQYSIRNDLSDDEVYKRLITHINKKIGNYAFYMYTKNIDSEELVRCAVIATEKAYINMKDLAAQKIDDALNCFKIFRKNYVIFANQLGHHLLRLNENNRLPVDRMNEAWNQNIKTLMICDEILHDTCDDDVLNVKMDILTNQTYIATFSTANDEQKKYAHSLLSEISGTVDAVKSEKIRNTILNNKNIALRNIELITQDEK